DVQDALHVEDEGLWGPARIGHRRRVYAAVSRSAVAEARGERVAHQHHVADLLDIGEPRPPGRVPGEGAVAHEPGCIGVADEDGRDHQLQLVDEVGGQELGVDRAAALDHQPLDAAGGQVGAQPPHLDAVAAVDDGRDLAQPGAGV